jgi:hypothetical protein
MLRRFLSIVICLQKPISNKDLVREIDNKINGSGITLNSKKKILKEKEILVSATL